MSWTLVIGDPAYSSWSLRGWLLFQRFGLPYTLKRISFLDDDVAPQIAEFAPARTVPSALSPEGAAVWDSLAIAEELAQRHREAGLWPSDPSARATARSLTAEMHSGFGALRETCPMNLRVSYKTVPVDEALARDLKRLEEIWAYARDRHGADGPWLCGTYSIADVFYAPVATRIATYNLPVGAGAAEYVATHLADPTFRQWRAIGMVTGPDLPWYARDYPQRMWPGPSPRPAQAVSEGPSENAECPYSGKPTSHFMELDGRVFGFCNAVCRDKTVADPEAWPAFMKLV